jgi:glutathione S-transferase
MLTLYFAPGSSSMAPHIALHEIGAAFESRPVSFAKRATHTPEFLVLNPEGKVPTLLIDGRPLTEVAAILLYLAKKFPDANLLPRGDLEGEAQAVSWMSYAAATLHGARGRGAEYGRAIWAVADRKLGGRDWALGAYSIADIHLFRLYWRFRPLLGAALGELPALDAHYDRMMARPAVRRTIALESAIGYELPR